MSNELPYNEEEMNLFMSVNKEITHMADHQLMKETKHQNHHHKLDHDTHKKSLLKKCEEQFFEKFEKELEKMNASCESFYIQLKADNNTLYQKVTKKIQEVAKKQASCKSVQDLSQCNQELFSDEVLKEIYEKGINWFQDKHFDISLLYFTFLSIVEGKNSQIWLMKGMCEQNLGHYEDALSAYALSISLDSSFLPAYIQTMDCLILAQDLNKATEVYDLFMHQINSHAYANNEYMLSKLETIREYLHQPAGK